MNNKNYNGVTIEKSWSLVGFAKEFGTPKFANCTNKETGEQSLRLVLTLMASIACINKRTLGQLLIWVSKNPIIVIHYNKGHA